MPTKVVSTNGEQSNTVKVMGDVLKGHDGREHKAFVIQGLLDVVIGKPGPVDKAGKFVRKHPLLATIGGPRRGKNGGYWAASVYELHGEEYTIELKVSKLIRSATGEPEAEESVEVLF